MLNRLAIVSSPRSGNTWTRLVLARALGIDGFAVHHWKDLPAELPKRCVLQIHWYREPNFQSFLLENDFRVLVLGRHPLDVLLSTLHFIRYEPLTARWLEGDCKIPQELVGAAPSSGVFVDYGLSQGAGNLLSVSYQWWHDPLASKIRYEDLLRDPGGRFAELLENIGEGCDRLRTALEETNIEKLKALPNRHGWQGRSGLWRKLIPTSSALRIYLHHRHVFSTLGYPPPVSLVTCASARRRWEQLKD